MPQSDAQMGGASQLNREFLFKNYIINDGIVTNWYDMKKVLNHAFHNVLQVQPEERKVLITEGPLNRKSNREKMVKVCAIELHFSNVYRYSVPILRLCSRPTKLLLFL